jgi:hypothetical protein
MTLDPELFTEIFEDLDEAVTLMWWSMKHDLLIPLVID